MSSLPPDPLSGSRQDAIATNEMYKLLRSGGHSALVSCVITAAVIVVNGLRGPDDA
jgi:hypothetical protein